jgi:hypothetical protein
MRYTFVLFPGDCQVPSAHNTIRLAIEDLRQIALLLPRLAARRKVWQPHFLS